VTSTSGRAMLNLHLNSLTGNSRPGSFLVAAVILAGELELLHS